MRLATVSQRAINGTCSFTAQLSHEKAISLRFFFFIVVDGKHEIQKSVVMDIAINAMQHI